MSLLNPYVLLHPFRDGFSINPCSNYFIFPSKQVNKLLPPPYTSACYNYTAMWEARSGKGPLTKRLCAEECILNKSLEAVGCVDPFFRTPSLKFRPLLACLTYEPSLADFADFKKVTEPVWLLGKEYVLQNDDEFEKLTKDVRTRLWFTYRKNFLPIGDSNLTSDSGWGCMHRCGQMLMGQALLLRHLGREWIWEPECNDKVYRNVLNLFNDKEECLYSIHKIASKGCAFEKQIGQWFGPNTVVQVLKKLTEESCENDIAVHVAMDSAVIKSEIKKLFCIDNASKSLLLDNSSHSKNGHPVLLAVPLRLGLFEIMPVYFEKLKASFTMKQSLGIIGGKTNHASYYIGCVGNELIYLDPHTTQVHKDGCMEDDTYHCSHPSRMPFTMLDPSIALCFYFKNLADFEEWCQECHRVLLEPEKDTLFEIMDEKLPLLSGAEIIGVDDFNTFDESDRLYTSDNEFELLM